MENNRKYIVVVMIVVTAIAGVFIGQSSVKPTPVKVGNIQATSIPQRIAPRTSPTISHPQQERSIATSSPMITKTVLEARLKALQRQEEILQDQINNIK